ncbi:MULTISPECIES: YgaP family membrane protein [Mucilaginibacter]|uniref:DUF2892 domain-containing protein n=1 Tax=Mucilaginibacter antarcticus TaxID=1855725 RepID=A0ABW5XKR6_9SPHI
MKKNMGITDRVLRVIAAVAIIVLYYTSVISGILAIILLIVAAIFIVTSFISFCPLYYPFGIKTVKTNAH